MLKKIWILMHCVAGKSYQETTERDTVKVLLSRIYINVLSVAKDLYPGTTQRDTWRVLLDRIVQTSKVKKVSKRLQKLKCINKFKPKVLQKVSQSIKTY